jgi:hypothetical protein
MAGLASLNLNAQSLGDFSEDESKLYAETKQVNQFIRRFNAEEDVTGDRLYSEDNDYRSRKLRKKYLPILFNLSDDILTEDLKNKFIDMVMDKDNPVYLNFHGGGFFAELKTIFLYQGKEQPVVLYLALQEEKVGSKWVITDIYFQPFKSMLAHPDTSKYNDSKFIHPLSHELGFMNLFRVFNNKDSLELYLEKGFEPDYLSIFLYEVKNNRMKFQTVSSLKFHFFQIDGWYFELSYFNREGYNTGWLISNLMEINEKDKQLLMNYIYHD